MPATNDISPDGVVTPPVESTPPAPAQVKEPVAPTPPKEPVAPAVKETTTPPVKEQETEGDVDFSQFLQVKDINVTPEKKTPEVKKELEVKKEDVTPEVPALKKEPEVEPTPEAVKARDFTGIEEADIPAFKRMSNTSFDRLKPLYLEHHALKQKTSELETQLKELKEKGPQIPENYLEHPQSFILTPEFAAQSNKVTQASQIVQHWEQQLQDIAEGATKYKTLVYNDKGELVLGPEYPADARAQAQISAVLTRVHVQLQREQGELQRIATTHQSRHREVISYIEDFSKKAFSIFHDPRSENLRKVVDDTIKQFPTAFQSNPLIRLLAQSLVTNQRLGILLQQKEKGQTPVVVDKVTGKVIDTEAQRKAGPTAGDVGAGNGKVTNGNEITFDDFKKVKEGV